MSHKYTKRERELYARKRAFLAALEASGGIIETACRSANVGRTTVFRWKKDDPDFCKQWEDIREASVSLVEAKLLECIARNNITAIIYYLNNKGKTLGYNNTESSNINLNIRPIEDLSIWAKEMDDAFLGKTDKDASDTDKDKPDSEQSKTA